MEQRWWPAFISLVVGILVLVAKAGAAWVTGSTALLSDALESTVNVAAAAFALWATRWAAQPADRDHPYGHGKMEFVSAVFEGGLVTLAAMLMMARGVQVLLGEPVLRQLDTGLLVTVGASVANGALGAWLVRRGRAMKSMALEADGIHVLTDVWTSVGVLAGLAIVRFTGWTVLDPAIAVIMGAWLLWQGGGVMRRAVGALLDEQDDALMVKVREALMNPPVPGVGGAHEVRGIRSGNLLHVDAHIHVPRDWTVAQAHDAFTAIQEHVRKTCGVEAEVALHLDPWPPVDG